MDIAISKLAFELGIGPFVHGRLQNLKTSEDTFGHGLTPLNTIHPTILPSKFSVVRDWPSE